MSNRILFLTIILVLTLVGITACIFLKNTYLSVTEQPKSWILAERLDIAAVFIELSNEDVAQFPRLLEALESADGNYGPPKIGLSAVVETSRFDGLSIQNFLISSYRASFLEVKETSMPYPFHVIVEGKYYGIAVQFTKPDSL